MAFCSICFEDIRLHAFELLLEESPANSELLTVKLFVMLNTACCCLPIIVNSPWKGVSLPFEPCYLDDDCELPLRCCDAYRKLAWYCWLPRSKVTNLSSSGKPVQGSIPAHSICLLTYSCRASSKFLMIPSSSSSSSMATSSKIGYGAG